MARSVVFHVFIAVLFLLNGSVIAQEWEFAKEKDGIKIYTRKEPGSNFKAFRGEADITATMDAVCAAVEDVEGFDTKEDDVELIRVLEHQPGKLIRYYVVYHVPWPFTNRDLCIETTIQHDAETGAVLLNARSVPDLMPEKPKLVRIVNYWQKWIIQPLSAGIVHVTIEGFADPAGDIPAWVANMAVTSSPYNTLKSIRDSVE